MWRGRGGTPARASCAAAATTVGLVDATKESAEACAEQLSLPMMESRDARMAIVAAAERFAREGRLSQAVAEVAGQREGERWAVCRESVGETFHSPVVSGGKGLQPGPHFGFELDRVQVGWLAHDVPSCRITRPPLK